MSNKPYPTPPLVSTAKVVYVGGINSSGTKGRNLYYDGYDCTVPMMPSHNFTAGLARFLPGCLKALSGVNSYLAGLKDVVLNCTKTIPDIVVGVSQGGAVAMSLVQKEWVGAKLLLVAPAWRTFGVDSIVPRDTTILHAKRDWVVPLADSQHLMRKNKCRLLKVNDNHYLGQSYGLILSEVDRLSAQTGKHKPVDVINTEWAEYHKARQDWVAFNCTKKVVTNKPQETRQ